MAVVAHVPRSPCPQQSLCCVAGLVPGKCTLSARLVQGRCRVGAGFVQVYLFSRMVGYSIISHHTVCLLLVSTDGKCKVGARLLQG